MATVPGQFGLTKSQAELDFVNVDLNRDTLLFVDPLGLSQRVDPWSVGAHHALITFFQAIVDRIRSGHIQEAQRLLYYLSEPNETRLGFSKGRSQGAGIGGDQAFKIFAALQASSAVKTGFIASLEDCELMVDG